MIREIELLAPAKILNVELPLSIMAQTLYILEQAVSEHGLPQVTLLKTLNNYADTHINIMQRFM